MSAIKRVQLVHRITLEVSLLKMLDKFDKLSTGLELQTIAHSAIAAGLDEEITEEEIRGKNLSVAPKNLDDFLTYCEDSFWAEHVPCDSLPEVTDLTAEIYTALYLEAGTVFHLMKQVDVAKVYDIEDGCTVEFVDCTLRDDHVDLTISLTCEP